MDLDLNAFFHLNAVISTEEMMILDNNSKYLGVPTMLLMENAGNAIIQSLIESNLDLKKKKICIFAGLGNNGGDVFVAARQLTFFAAEINLFLLGDPINIRTEISKLNWDALQSLDYSVQCHVIKDSSQLKDYQDIFSQADIVIDGILGTGIKGKLREPVKSAIQIINDLKAFKCSVDVPSGVNPDTSKITDNAIKADITVTFHKAKTGLIISPNAGKLFIKNIGIPPEAEFVVGKGDLLSFNMNRPLKAHKGDFGKVLVIGGSNVFAGAPALVSLAALRTGSDLVNTIMPSSTASSARAFSPNLIVTDYEGKYFNKIGLDLVEKMLDWPSAIAIGPGLGREVETMERVVYLISLIADKKIPTVIDADALKAIKDDLNLLGKGNFVLTPHLGEYNIISNQNLDYKIELNDLIKNVYDFSKKINATVLVKGEIDIISNGKGIKINKTGTPALTVGGTGDVLTGITASLMGMKVDAFRSASIAAFINGIAGELATDDLQGNHLVASDLLNYIPDAFNI